ncbi:MAG: twin-arginine translocase subunit TatB [Halioglobus sp.]|nr:twin-arginine translocase subunit TatB [Halioglobus sp.]|tara:strand:- start:4270 stop:4602 length:333 start_codon:yes stop_codon:yes gene_type:complete
MFDIGFAELVIIGVVALVVIGPERLPGTIRTVSAYVNRLRRGFNDIKREVQQELHNDAVMRELREAGEQLKDETQALGRGVSSLAGDVTDRPQEQEDGAADARPAEKKPE